MIPIKYLCFDIGEVANVRLPDYIVVSLVQKRWGKKFSEKDWDRMVYSGKNKDYWREFQNGCINAETYIDSAFKTAEIQATADNNDFFRSLLQEWCGIPYQPILDLVEKLKQKGYHTSVLSNNNEIMYNTPGAEIKNRVEVSLSSHFMGISKPNLKVYHTLLEKIGAENPYQVIFVDDQETNVSAARELGINGFRFRSKETGMNKAFEELLQFLKEKKVKF